MNVSILPPLFSGIVCFGFQTLKDAIDGQRHLIETDASDSIDDAELIRGVQIIRPFDEDVELETFYAIATVTKAIIPLMLKKPGRLGLVTNTSLTGYAGMFYIISMDPANQLRTALTQNAHKIATPHATTQYWTEHKNRWGPLDTTKYTLEEIKRIYRAHVVGQELAQA